MNTKIEDEIEAKIVDAAKLGNKAYWSALEENIYKLIFECRALRAQVDQQAQPQAIPTKQMLWAGTEAFREIVNGAEVDNPALHIFERMIAASQKERGK